MARKERPLMETLRLGGFDGSFCKTSPSFLKASDRKVSENSQHVHEFLNVLEHLDYWESLNSASGTQRSCFSKPSIRN